MEEQEFKATYREVNQRRCLYEKAISSRRCGCSQSNRFFLADREGIACTSALGLEQCTTFLKALREKARFSLRLTGISGPLPHAGEIKIQTGGLLGLQGLVYPEKAAETKVPDINDLISQALHQYGQFSGFPYEGITQAITRFEGRRRRR